MKHTPLTQAQASALSAQIDSMPAEQAQAIFKRLLAAQMRIGERLINRAAEVGLRTAWDELFGPGAYRQLKEDLYDVLTADRAEVAT